MYGQHKTIVVQAYCVRIDDSIQMWSFDRHIFWRVEEMHYTDLDVEFTCRRGRDRTTLTFRAGELLNVSGRMRRQG